MRNSRSVVLSSLFCATVAVQQAGAQDVSDGEELFNDNCASCHNEGGIGVPGLAPPLDRPAFWQALGDDAPRYIGGVVTKGFNMPIAVRGERYAGLFMTPLASTSDQDLAGIASWVLGTLGQIKTEVTPELIAEIRASSMSNQDLKAMRPKTE